MEASYSKPVILFQKYFWLSISVLPFHELSFHHLSSLKSDIWLKLTMADFCSKSSRISNNKLECGDKKMALM